MNPVNDLNGAKRLNDWNLWNCPLHQYLERASVLSERRAILLPAVKLLRQSGTAPFDSLRLALSVSL